MSPVCCGIGSVAMSLINVASDMATYPMPQRSGDMATQSMPRQEETWLDTGALQALGELSHRGSPWISYGKLCGQFETRS